MPREAKPNSSEGGWNGHLEVFGLGNDAIKLML